MMKMIMVAASAFAPGMAWAVSGETQPSQSEICGVVAVFGMNAMANRQLGKPLETTLEEIAGLPDAPGVEPGTVEHYLDRFDKDLIEVLNEIAVIAYDHPISDTEEEGTDVTGNFYSTVTADCMTWEPA